MEPDAPGDWWQSFYNDTLADMLLVRRDALELDATTRFLTAQLGLGPGSSVFDQCCGIGSLSVALAERGMRVTGVDQCEPYVRRGREAAAGCGLRCDLRHGDAFEFLPDRPCDAAFNWYTSFGYAADDARNGRMLRRAFDALRPGGTFALDFPNVPGLLRRFRPTTLQRNAGPGGEVLLVRESEIDLATGTLRQEWIYLLPGGRRINSRSALRLYMPHALAGMLGACGFGDVRFYGSVAGEGLTLDSPRCIAVARRPQ